MLLLPVIVIASRTCSFLLNTRRAWQKAFSRLSARAFLSDMLDVFALALLPLTV